MSRRREVFFQAQEINMPILEIDLDVECANLETSKAVRSWMEDEINNPSEHVMVNEPSLEDLHAPDPLVVGLVIGFVARAADGAAKEVGKQAVAGLVNLLQSLRQRLFNHQATSDGSTEAPEDTCENAPEDDESVTIRVRQDKEFVIALTMNTTELEIRVFAESAVEGDMG